MEQQEGPPILALDDKCIRKVFHFLKLPDLCNTADSCKRFKKIATEIFQSKLTDLNILQLIQDEKHFHDEWFMVRWQVEEFLERAEQLLRNFGQHIRALQLTGHGDKGGMDENELLLLVKNHCSSLKELTLLEMGGSDDFSAMDLLPLFNCLEKLSVDSTDVCDSFAALLADCRELKYLNVSNVPATMFVNQKFPKLNTLIVSNNWAFDYSEFESFLRNHSNLQTLSYEERDVLPEMFSIIANASPQLENLNCNIDGICCEDSDQQEVERNVLQLSKIKSLRSFTVSCDDSEVNLLIGAFDNADTPIEHFGIVDCNIDEHLIAGLSKLKWLRTLHLKGCSLDEKAFVAVNNNLNRLNQVTFEDMKGFNVDGHHLQLACNIRVTRSISKIIIQDRDSFNILNALNDDCLLAIFECLPLQDLCTVADVCQTFKQNAETSFQLHYSSFDTEKITAIDGGKHKDMQVAERLFRNFGHLIQELCVNGSENEKDRQSVMHLANKYCPSKGFKSLALYDIHFKDDLRWMLPLLNMFIRLEKLELHSCMLNEKFGKFLSCCHIREIYVHSFYGDAEWMNNQFCYVGSMILYDIWQPESAIEKFIKLNGHLQLLAIKHYYISSQIFRTIARHMYRLQALYVFGKCPTDRRVRQNVLHLAKLKNLKRLKLNCSRFSLVPLIDALSSASTQLTELNIKFGTVDLQLLEKLSQLKSSLNSLALDRAKLNGISLNDVLMKLPDLDELEVDIHGIGVKDIINMLPLAKKLTKLSVGSLKSDVKIDIVSYQSTLAIVKSRGIRKSLHICITSEDNRVSVPQHLLQENQYWLKIENEIFADLRSVMSDSDSEFQGGEFSDESSSDEEEDSSEESNDGVSSEESVDDSVDMQAE